MASRLRAALVAALAGSLLVATRRRRRAPGKVVQEKAGKVRRTVRRRS